MKILLIYTNRYKFISPPPICFAFLAEGLKKNNHDYEILDLMFVKDPEQEIKKALIHYNPDIVGVSVRNLDSQIMEKKDNPLIEIKNYIDIIKKHNKKVILGGTAFSTMHSEMFDYMNADFGIIGQGEESLPALLNCLQTNKNYTDIPGIVYRENDEICFKKNIIKGFSGTKPDWNVINFKEYNKTNFWCGCLLIKTGCPYKCIYCESHRSMGTKFLFRSNEEIINDIEEMYKGQKIRSYFLLDPCFNSPLDRAKEILYAIIKKSIKIHIYSAFLPIKDAIDDELIDLYKRAGGIVTFLSPDTLSDTMLKNYKKPFDMDAVFYTGNLLKKHNLPFVVDIIFGGPGENRQTFIESVQNAKKLPYSMLHWVFGMRILPQTGLYDIAYNEKLVQGPSELLYPKFYASGDFDINWAKKYIKKELFKYSFRSLKLFPFVIRSMMGRYLNLY